MKKTGDLLAITASILAIIVSFIALSDSAKTRAKAEEIQKGLGKLTQETMYLAYYTRIVAPKNDQRFNQQYVKMEVSFGRDITQGDHIWIVGFDGNNKYPLRKIDMAKGERTWSSNIELPHKQEWTLYVYQVNSENSVILQGAYQDGQHLDKLNSSAFSYLDSVKVVYSDM